jgi:pyruvate formate lyase activating enzyme
MHPALYSEALSGNRVQCQLCPHNCILAPGKTGLCGVRQNINGTLLALNYGQAIALHIDPIEKKPLYHVHPGSRSFSIAAMGCNFSCHFCQNHEISQVKPGTDPLSGRLVTPQEVVTEALANDCRTIACTYTEPTVFFEYALEICRLARAQNIDTVWVTNGYINEAPLREIAPFLTAANVDLKGWDEEFYRNIVGGLLQPVLSTLKLMKELGIWLEVTTLVVPGHIDNEKSLREIALFIRNELGPETPWHISRFYPQYRMAQLPATDLAILHRARQIGFETGLQYVYCGNAPGDVGENTYCHRCGAILIERNGFEVITNNLQQGRCPACSTKIEGIF